MKTINVTTCTTSFKKKKNLNNKNSGNYLAFPIVHVSKQEAFCELFPLGVI